MIRKVLFAISALCCLWACKDDEAVFDMPVPEEGISFEPTTGGTIMRYTAAGEFKYLRYLRPLQR